MNELDITPAINQAYFGPAFHVPKASFVPKGESTIEQRRGAQAVPQLTIEEQWINTLGVEISIIQSGNKHIVLKPNNPSRSQQRGVIIKRTYKWESTYVDFNVSNLSFVDKKTDVPKEVFDQMVEDRENNQYGPSRYLSGTVTLFISEYDLASHRYSIYVEELSAVIAKTSIANRLLHPASSSALIKSQIDNAPKSLVFKIFANDPQGERSKRYVNLNGHVIEIPVINEPTMAAGIYQTVPYDHATGEAYKETFESFDTADEAFNLYKTREAAEDHFGHAKLAAEKELIRVKAEAEEAKIKRDEEFKEKEKALTLAHQQVIKDMTLEHTRKLNQIKENRLQRDDMYDSASTYRKNWSETFKWLPAVITGIVTVVGVCIALLL